MQPIPNTKSKGYLREKFEAEKRAERKERIEKRVRYLIAVGIAILIFLKFKPL